MNLREFLFEPIRHPLDGSVVQELRNLAEQYGEDDDDEPRLELLSKAFVADDAIVEAFPDEEDAGLYWHLYVVAPSVSDAPLFVGVAQGYEEKLSERGCETLLKGLLGGMARAYGGIARDVARVAAMAFADEPADEQVGERIGAHPEYEQLMMMFGACCGVVLARAQDDHARVARALQKAVSDDAFWGQYVASLAMMAPEAALDMLPGQTAKKLRGFLDRAGVVLPKSKRGKS